MRVHNAIVRRASRRILADVDFQPFAERSDDGNLEQVPARSLPIRQRNPGILYDVFGAAIISRIRLRIRSIIVTFLHARLPSFLYFYTAYDW